MPTWLQKLLVKVGQLAFSYVKDLAITKVPAKFKQITLVFLDKIQRFGDILLDTNTKDGKQIGEELMSLFSDRKLEDFQRAELEKLLSNVDNAKFKRLLSLIVNPLIASEQVLTDTITTDKAQLGKVWENWFKSPEVTEALWGLFSNGELKIASSKKNG